MSVAPPEVVIDLSVLVGELDAVPCEDPDHKGDETASWYMLCLCCAGQVQATCNECKTETLNVFERWLSINCLMCHRTDHWRKIRRFEPMKGTS